MEDGNWGHFERGASTTMKYVSRIAILQIHPCEIYALIPVVHSLIVNGLF